MVRSRFLLAGLLGCLVATWCATSSGAEASSSPQVLHLHTEFLPYKRLDKNDVHSRLTREVIRQSLLIAARDEMGLMTCDETLRETPPSDAQVLDLMLIERVNSSGNWRLSLIEHREAQDIHKTKPLWTKTFKSAVGGSRLYGFVVPKLEEDSRREFVEALQLAGLKGEKPANNKPSSPSDEIQQSLLQVDFIAQFGAVRSAHQAIAAHGETPEWLGVLVRGYANLAMLTQHQWNSSSEVFAARAWLYAQRMFASKKARDLAIWHRAYAWALGGTFQHALEELERLERRRAENAAAPFVPPVWAKLIEPYAMCDRVAVNQVGEENPALRGWATRLGFQLTSAYRQSRWMYEAANDVKRDCPTAYGVYAELAHHGQSLGVTRTGAQLAPIMYGNHSPASLLKVPGLPDEFKAVLSVDEAQGGFLNDVFGDPDPDDSFSAVPSYMARYLREETEKNPDGDLSWSALAFLLEEEQLVQAANYLNVAGNATEHSRTEQIESILPLVKGHRYAAYLDSYRYHSRRDWVKMQKLLTNVVIDDPRRNMSPLFQRLWWIRTPEKKIIGYYANHYAFRNFTLPGMLEYIYTKDSWWTPDDPNFGAACARDFSGIAPHSETATRMAIQAATDPTLEDLQNWEGKLKQDPTAFNGLAWRYHAKGEVAAAVRCFEKSLASLPTYASTRDLANLHFEENDREKWKQTLLDFLQTESLGLDHAQAHKQLAVGYLSLGDWANARPHAEKAGETWSSWGLEIASYVCEGLADWEASERWIRERSTSYPSGSGDAWYFWCRRTGRGDVETARKLAEKFHTRDIRTLEFEDLFRLGAFLIMENKPVEAVEIYRKSFVARASFECTYMIAQLSRELGNEEPRKKVIAIMEEANKKAQGDPEHDGTLDEVGLAVLELLKSGDASPKRLKKLDELLGPIEPSTRSLIDYFLGRELAALGRAEEAEKYWRRALVQPGNDTNCATLAGMELAKRHGRSRPDDDALGVDDLWPLPADEEN